MTKEIHIAAALLTAPNNGRLLLAAYDESLMDFRQSVPHIESGGGHYIRSYPSSIPPGIDMGLMPDEPQLFYELPVENVDRVNRVSSAGVRLKDALTTQYKLPISHMRHVTAVSLPTSSENPAVRLELYRAKPLVDRNTDGMRWLSVNLLDEHETSKINMGRYAIRLAWLLRNEEVSF